MPTIPDTLRMTARRVPDTAALTFGERTYSYRELDAAVDCAARALEGLGLRRGDRLALMSPSTDRFVVVFYAALRLGAIFVSVNPALAAPEVEYILRDSGARILAYDPELAEVIGSVRPTFEAADLTMVVLDGGGADPDLTALCRERGPVDEVLVRLEESDDALILYTSGTTGTPKGALFDHHRIMWVAFNCVTTCGMRPGDRLLHVAPLYHAAQLCIMLVPGTTIGATHIVQGGFDADAALSALESERITMFFGVPAMFQLLLGHPRLRTGDFRHWRTALFGAAPMPSATVAAVMEALPTVELMQLCGQTEAGPGGIYANAEQVAARPDASGRQALPFTEVRIVDGEENDVSPGEVGELILRGETVMKGYWGKPEETAETLRGGWLRTGDLAQVDDEGYITLVDRLKDMIITGGRNVYSVEVENAVARHPDVLDCAVVGKPHPVYGESIVAVITVGGGAIVTLDDIREVCRGQIASFKVPHDVVTGAIPRNPSGKVLKRELRRALTDTRDHRTAAAPA